MEKQLAMLKDIKNQDWQIYLRHLNGTETDKFRLYAV